MLTAVVFVRAVEAVFGAVAAQLSGDADAVATAPVGLQAALGGGAAVLVRARGTLRPSVAAGGRVDAAYGVHAGELTRRALGEPCGGGDERTA